MSQFEAYFEEETDEEAYEIFVFTDYTETEYGICFSGDQVLRACTVEGIRFDDLTDIFVITEWPESYEKWVELLNDWIERNEIALGGIKMKQLGIYFVDATGLEGWTDETLAEALEMPLASIGLGVEIGQHNTGIVFYQALGYGKEETLREQASHIIAKVVTQ